LHDYTPPYTVTITGMNHKETAMYRSVITCEFKDPESFREIVTAIELEEPIEIAVFPQSLMLSQKSWTIEINDKLVPPKHLVCCRFLLNFADQNTQISLILKHGLDSAELIVTPCFGYLKIEKGVENFVDNTGKSAGDDKAGDGQNDRDG
jgi:hypothetical protein